MAFPLKVSQPCAEFCWDSLDGSALIPMVAINIQLKLPMPQLADALALALEAAMPPRTEGAEEMATTPAAWKEHDTRDKDLQSEDLLVREESLLLEECNDVARHLVIPPPGLGDVSASIPGWPHMPPHPAAGECFPAGAQFPTPIPHDVPLDPRLQFIMRPEQLIHPVHGVPMPPFSHFPALPPLPPPPPAAPKIASSAAAELQLLAISRSNRSETEPRAAEASEALNLPTTGIAGENLEAGMLEKADKAGAAGLQAAEEVPDPEKKESLNAAMMEKVAGLLEQALESGKTSSEEAQSSLEEKRDEEEEDQQPLPTEGFVLARSRDALNQDAAGRKVPEEITAPASSPSTSDDDVSDAEPAPAFPALEKSLGTDGPDPKLEDPIEVNVSAGEETGTPASRCSNEIAHESSQQDAADMLGDVQWVVVNRWPGPFRPPYGFKGKEAKMAQSLAQEVLDVLQDGKPQALSVLRGTLDFKTRFDNCFFRQQPVPDGSWKKWLATLPLDFVYDYERYHMCQGSATHVRLQQFGHADNATGNDNSWETWDGSEMVDGGGEDAATTGAGAVSFSQSHASGKEWQDSADEQADTIDWIVSEQDPGEFAPPYGVGTKEARLLEQEVLNLLDNGTVYKIGSLRGIKSIGLRFNQLFWQRRSVNNGSWKKWLATLPGVELLCNPKTSPNHPDSVRLRCSQELQANHEKLAAMLGKWYSNDGQSYVIYDHDAGKSLTVQINRRNGKVEIFRGHIRISDTGQILWGSTSGIALYDVSQNTLVWQGPERRYAWKRAG
eukprot:TRINITY_DN1991_c0_g1_i1.p1 TRINITY_DN1991_c0_g1~~TRINITY_DN1991_c0_g1_i1.p1  ORF type:complete len:804 (+),score=159.60 TRINITY_DN1991_c0_g1_i1:65-2413(+)